MSTSSALRLQTVPEEARVAPIELFFDLVFVFSLTQVTSLMADDLSIRGLVRGLLVLSLLWWVWVGYAWLGNVVRADEGAGRVAMFAAMAAAFVMALAIPEAFSDLPGGLPGPVVVGLGYLLVRVLHLTIFWMASGENPALRSQLKRFALAMIGGTVLLLLASQLQGPWQTAAWAAALVADYVGTILGGASGWQLNSASHFAERHGLILIVALGESIVAIGVGVAALPISWPIVAASILGLSLAGALWWAYFDVAALVAERVLHRAQGEERARLARDSYSYLHLPMVAGVIVAALGLKKVLEYVGDSEAHDLIDTLELMPLLALYGGVMLYFLAHVAFRYRNIHSVNLQRLLTVALLAALIPLAAQIPALGALTLITAVVVGLIAFEAIHFAEVRDRARHEGAEEVSHLRRRPSD